MNNNDADKKLLENLHAEMSKLCAERDLDLCRNCYVDIVRRAYGLSAEDVYCSAFYIVMKLLGESQDSIDYYMDNITKIRKTCKDETTEDCHNCKYGDSFNAEMPCYSYVIGMNLLKEVN